MTEELLDAYDDDGNHIGVFSRAEVHERGLWHRVFHVLVVADREGVDTAILQRRSLAKAAFPGLLDLSAAGHIMAGETPEEGLREMHEELGIDTSFDQLLPLGQFEICDEDDAAEGNNREVAHCFVVRDDRALTNYRPDLEEVDGLAEVPLDKLIELFADPANTAPCREVSQDGSDTTTDITVSALVPDVNDYWPTVLNAARTALK